MKNIGEKTKEFRLARSWNTTQMAKHVGTSRQNIENLEEKGDMVPRYVAKLAKALGVTVDCLIDINADLPEFTAPPSATPEASHPAAGANQRQPAAAAVLENLRLLLLQADPADRIAAGSLLSGLANNPENPRILSALAAMLGDLTDARPVADEIEEPAWPALPPRTIAEAERASLALQGYSDSLRAKRPRAKKRKES